MRINTEVKLGFKDVLILPKRSTLDSRSDVDLERSFTFLHSGNWWKGTPIVASNMNNVGTVHMFLELNKYNILTVLHKYYTINQLNEELPNMDFSNLSLSTGILNEDLERIDNILKHYNIPFICIDIANGYTEKFVGFVKKVRDKYPNKNIIAGNVVTGEMVEALILSGADVVKVGIGSGSVCTTRLKTGVGYPQLSAVIECSDSAHGLEGLVMSDGGCITPGDIVKSFGGGADFCMTGGMLAGTEETIGKYGLIRDKEGKITHVEFFGMSSKEAMKVNTLDEMEDYKTEEGKSVFIKAKGPVKYIIQDILGGLRSACTYVGARKLKELSKRCTFILTKEQENQVFNE